jgi:hypothetical protein
MEEKQGVNSMQISGVIQSGAGKGAYFTQVDWVVRQCREMLGYRPFPGTLNVSVKTDDMAILTRLWETPDFELVPDDPAFCAAQVKKIELNGIVAAVVLPSEDVRIHETCVLEVMAPCNLKEALGLSDGDTVCLSWSCASDQDANPTRNNIEAQSVLYREIYEFAASAGALEGFVYPRQELAPGQLDNWIRNLGKQYLDLSENVRKSFQPSLDRTLGRAVQALIPVLGPEHEYITALKKLIAGEMPSSPFDFEKEKEEKASKYG